MDISSIKDDISVVIQGPIDDRTYESIDAFANQGFTDIIISTWDNQDTELLKKSSSTYKVFFSKSPTEENLYYINNEGSRFYQAVTTLNGCVKSDREYVIKTRSDEVYPNLDKFIENFKNNQDKLHTTNNGFWKHIPFCFSNHLFIAKRTVLTDACTYIIEHCIGEQFKGLQLFCAEQEFGYFLMYALDNDFDPSKWNEYFKDHVYITPCSELPDHLHSGGTGKSFHFKRRRDYPQGRPDPHPINNLYNSNSEF